VHVATEPASRLIGIDLARLVAVAGMMAAHTLGWDEPEPAAVVALIDGPPSTLFAVLGGVSVVLAARARLAAGDRGGAVRSTLMRGLLVAALGLVVIPFAPAVYVVLVPFGAAIAAAAALVLLPTWLLAAVAVAISGAGGWLVVRSREALPGLDDAGTHSLATLLGEPLPTALDVLLTGVYPALIWVGYLAIGMVVARGLLAARAAGREGAALAAIGAVGAALLAAGLVATEAALRIVDGDLAGPLSVARDLALENGYGAAHDDEPVWQLLATPHSGTPADIARTVGMALLVIAVLGLVTAALRPRALRALEPIRAAGAAPLTIYVVHVTLVSLLLSALEPVAPEVVTGWVGWALQVAVALAIGAILAATRSKGPLERLVARAADAAAGGAARPRPAGPAHPLP
jgi:uncharacterized membrane protein